MPSTTTASTVVIEAELASHYDAHHVAKKLTDVYLTSAQVPSGASHFSVTVPASRTLTRAAAGDHGYVNVIVAIYSGGRVTQQQLSVPVSESAARRNTRVMAEVRSRQVSVASRFPGFKAGRIPQKCCFVPCNYSPINNEFEKTTRIGQVHVVDQTGMSEDFDYGTNADSTISVGVSPNPGSNFTGSGTLTITNSIGTDAGFTASAGTVQHVLTQVYYQEYQDNGADSCNPNATYKVEPASATGSAFLGTTDPPAGPPYGTCTADPYGYVTVQANTGHWGADFGTAETENVAMTLWGMNYAATSGYSSTLYDNYHNNTPHNQSLCGTDYMPDVHTIYNVNA
jgi:hypothetical protein